MSTNPSIDARADELHREHTEKRHVMVSRMFAVLLVVQYVACVGAAWLVSPYAWAGKERVLHMHVWVALLGGAGIMILPVLLAWFRPAAPLTRHVIAASQILSSALLIHLTGGRIETHFHIFGSLAFLAFYLDWRVILTATVVVAGDHFARGVFWPESVYGVANPEWWRFLEHAGWVAFEDVFLIWSCIFGARELRAAAVRQAEVEHLSEQEQLKTAALEMALSEIRTATA
jgi:two-component system, NtrC family, sensor histidine kinase HydH